MDSFVKGETNVLVCTTILESGIDIPNANTIIVENADRLGLAQLYQIRGRVGRSEKQAYCYITYKRSKALSDVADKRLKAIKEFTEFGSGFKIAMRDLEIRGAGSLMGELQHGHLEQVDIAICKDEEDIKVVKEDLKDRFGYIPTEIENLLQITRIRNLARQKNVVKIVQRGNNIVYHFEPDDFDIEIVSKLIMKFKNRIKFSNSKIPYLTFSLNNGDCLEEVKNLLEVL